MRHFLSITFTSAMFLLVLLSASCNVNVNEDSNAAADTLLVIHTNDHHGAVFPNGGLGGLSQRAAFVKTLRSQYKNILLLDAGDINTGGVLSNAFKAEPDILGYNMIGYDAVTLGNHEFDNDYDILRRQMDAAAFTFISANVKTTSGEQLAEPYIVRKFGGVVVAVIGITTSTTPQGAMHGKRYVFDNEITAAREAVKKIREAETPDIIILLTHVGVVEETPGFVTSLTLADSVAGVGLIIDGHSHTRMAAPVVRNGVPIVSAFEWGKEVGQARLIFAGGQVSFEWKSTAVTSEFPTCGEIDAMIKTFADSLQGSMGDTVAEAAGEFPFNDAAGKRLPRMGESAIGNLVCDAVMRFIGNSKYAADFALINGGGIRAGLPQGAVTREDVFKALPFENFVEIIELTGIQVMELFDHAAAFSQDAGGFAQVSVGARYVLDVSARTVSGVTINGAAVDPEKKYRVATTDYLASGGDSYNVFARGGASVKTQKPLADIVVEYLQSFAEPIVPVLDGRITVINDNGF